MGYKVIKQKDRSPAGLPDSGEAISLDDQTQVIQILGQSVQGLWEVVNNLTRLRPKTGGVPRHDFRIGPHSTRTLGVWRGSRPG